VTAGQRQTPAAGVPEDGRVRQAERAAQPESGGSDSAR
jgi:hypothetical protein